MAETYDLRTDTGRTNFAEFVENYEPTGNFRVVATIEVMDSDDTPWRFSINGDTPAESLTALHDALKKTGYTLPAAAIEATKRKHKIAGIGKLHAYGSKIKLAVQKEVEPGVVDEAQWEE